MSDDYSVFGQLPQMTPSGKTKNSKEVPVDKDYSRRRMKRRRREEPPPGERDAQNLPEDEKQDLPSGKVLDITI